MKPELHIFTNCTATAPKADIIKKTYQSFISTFGDIKTTVWVDSKPSVNAYEKYLSNLKTIFQDIKKSESLSDGYIKAIKTSDADYLFMLEHDWTFNTDLIKHSLNEIIQIMDKNGIYHLRFNKRINLPIKWDTVIEEMDFDGFMCCKTPIMSNNPHIINRKKYLEFIDKKYVKIMPGSKGLEEELRKQKNLHGIIYGPVEYPATITHLDGRA